MIASAAGVHPLVREFLALDPDPVDVTVLECQAGEGDWIEMVRIEGRQRAIAEARQDELAARILSSRAARRSAVDVYLSWEIAARHVRSMAAAEAPSATSALYLALERADDEALDRILASLSPQIVNLGGGSWASAAGAADVEGDAGVYAVTVSAHGDEALHRFAVRPADIDRCDIGIAPNTAPRELRRMVQAIWRMRGRVLIWETQE